MRFSFAHRHRTKSSKKQHNDETETDDGTSSEKSPITESLSISLDFEDIEAMGREAYMHDMYGDQEEPKSYQFFRKISTSSRVSDDSRDEYELPLHEPHARPVFAFRDPTEEEMDPTLVDRDDVGLLDGFTKEEHMEDLRLLRTSFNDDEIALLGGPESPYEKRQVSYDVDAFEDPGISREELALHELPLWVTEPTIQPISPKTEVFFAEQEGFFDEENLSHLQEAWECIESSLEKSDQGHERNHIHRTCAEASRVDDCDEQAREETAPAPLTLHERVKRQRSHLHTRKQQKRQKIRQALGCSAQGDLSTVDEIPSEDEKATQCSQSMTSPRQRNSFPVQVVAFDPCGTEDDASELGLNLEESIDEEATEVLTHDGRTECSENDGEGHYDHLDNEEPSLVEELSNLNLSCVQEDLKKVEEESEI